MKRKSRHHSLFLYSLPRLDGDESVTGLIPEIKGTGCNSLPRLDGDESDHSPENLVSSLAFRVVQKIELVKYLMKCKGELYNNLIKIEILNGNSYFVARNQGFWNKDYFFNVKDCKILRKIEKVSE